MVGINLELRGCVTLGVSENNTNSYVPVVSAKRTIKLATCQRFRQNELQLGNLIEGSVFFFL